MQKLHDPTPSAPLKIKPVLWFLWSCMVVFGLLVGFVFLSDTVMVDSSRRYMGTLKPNQKIASVTLPAEIPLKTVLVKPGEVVARGQTVALLDVVAIKEKLSQINLSISVAGIFRECLLSLEDERLMESYFEGEIKMTEKPMLGDVREDEVELNLRTRTVLAECKNNWREQQITKRRLETALKTLREKLKLIDQKLAMVLSFEKDERNTNRVHPVARAHAGISIALQKNKLTGQIQTLTNEIVALSVDAHKQRLVRVSKLSEEVSSLFTQRAILTKYLQSPRLRAPSAGTIERVKPILASKAYNSNEQLIDLRPEGAAKYQAELRASSAELEGLVQGAEVTVTLLGFTERGPQLQGIVADLNRGENYNGQSYVVAKIELTEESASMLAKRANGIALRGETTASAISVTMSQQSLREKLTQTFKKQLVSANWTESQI